MRRPVASAHPARVKGSLLLRSNLLTGHELFWTPINSDDSRAGREQAAVAERSGDTALGDATGIRFHRCPSKAPSTLRSAGALQNLAEDRRFMGSPLVRADLLTGLEPQNSITPFVEKEENRGRFMGSLDNKEVACWDPESSTGLQPGGDRSLAVDSRFQRLPGAASDSE